MTLFRVYLSSMSVGLSRTKRRVRGKGKKPFSDSCRKKTESRRALDFSSGVNMPSIRTPWNQKKPPWSAYVARDASELSMPINSLTYAQRTHSESLGLLRWLSPSTWETQARCGVRQEILTLLKNVDPNASVDIFGSLMYGVALPLSDIDLNITTACEKLQTPGKLSQLLRISNLYHNIRVLHKAKIPVVKCVHAHSRIKLDFTINTCSGRITGLCAQKLFNTFPAARPLVILIKLILHQRGLDDPSSGGLSSYGLCLMIFSFLQHRSESKPVKGYGQLLVEFFYHYGYDFDHFSQGVDVLQTRYVKKPAHISLNHIYIIDPTDKANNVGRASTRYPLVWKTFRIAYQMLTTALPDELEKKKSILGRLIVPDSRLDTLR